MIARAALNHRDAHNGWNLCGSALTDDVAVPDRHHADETKLIVIMPNRNVIMLAIACGIPVARGGEAAASGEDPRANEGPHCWQQTLETHPT